MAHSVETKIGCLPTVGIADGLVTIRSEFQSGNSTVLNMDAASARRFARLIVTMADTIDADSGPVAKGAAK